MTRSPLWREFESGDGIILRVLRILILGGGMIFLFFAGSLQLTWPQQAVLGLLLVLVAIWVDRSSNSYLITLTLMLLSCFSTFRYGSLAHLYGHQVFPRSREPGVDAAGRFLHLATGPCGNVCLRDSVPWLHANAMAAAPHTSAVA